MHKKITVLILFLISFHFVALSQDSAATRKMELKVLSKMAIGETFRFNVSTKKEERNEVLIKYLGTVKTKDKAVYKVLTWVRISGANFHTTGVISLFGLNNKFIGKYVLGDMADLPYKIVANSLIFTNKNKPSCNKTLVTKICFDNIPKDIFIKCEGDNGDIYSFATN